MEGAYIGTELKFRIEIEAGGTMISRVLTVVQSGKDITIITRNDIAITENEVAVGYEQ